MTFDQWMIQQRIILQSHGLIRPDTEERTVSKTFERESRYIVVKIKDAINSNGTFNGEVALRAFLKSLDIPTREGLVIEKDWPEYEPTWAAIERRVTGVQWDGEGLPPAGSVCELRMVAAGGDWHRAEVKFASRNVIVWEWEGESQINGLCSAYIHTVQFRPARTPEQIEADERKAAIEKMAADAQLDFSAGELLSAREYVECAIAALHDAGYRKQVAP